ncbi:MAG: hypothetical protein HYS26_01395 [Candidatus Kaiserbacteria bacterium]|nr:MAG: hypothetical protein HYS26_01395 [Candidatus Kaiserbacteria bacterium]
MEPTSTGSNKLYYIIGGVVALLVLGWLLTRGFGGAAGANVDRNFDGSTTYSNEEGSVTVGAQSMPANWPSDAPQNFAGATISFSGASNPQTGQAGAAVSYTVRASAQAVIDYYRGSLTSAGWTIVGSANAGGATVISAAKDERTFGVWATDNGDGSATVTAGVGM